MLQSDTTQKLCDAMLRHAATGATSRTTVEGFWLYRSNICLVIAFPDALSYAKQLDLREIEDNSKNSPTIFAKNSS